MAFFDDKTGISKLYVFSLLAKTATTVNYGELLDIIETYITATTFSYTRC